MTRRGRSGWNKKGDQYLFRFPPGMRARMEERAEKSGRALIAEIIQAMEMYLATPCRIDLLESRMTYVEDELIKYCKMVNGNVREKQHQ